MDDELQTPEEVQRRVLDYLKSCATADTGEDPRAFTLTSIHRALNGVPLKHVEQALSYLEEKDRIKSRSVAVKVYVPENSQGNRIVARFAKAQSIHFSTAWAIFFAIAGVGILIHYLNLYRGYDDPTVASVQRTAFDDAMTFAALVCVPIGYGLSIALSRFLRWRIVSAAAYAQIARLAKWCAIAGIASVGSFWALAQANVVRFDGGIAVAVGAVAIAVVSGYFFFVMRPQWSEAT